LGNSNKFIKKVLVFSLPKSSNFLNGLKILKSIYEIKFLNKRIPLFCEWELTNYCNMSCPFCSTLTEDRNSAADVSPQEALNMIDQLAEMGTKIIHFSGGEPTLRTDLPDLIARAKQHQIMVSFTTNGSASNSRMEKLLDTDIIRVSIDGTETFHDFNRVSPGAYKKAVEILRFLVLKGKKPIITTIVMDDTPYEMFEKLADLAQKLKIKMSLNVFGNSFVENNHGYDTHQIDERYANYISIMRKLRAQFGDVIFSPEPLLSIIKEGGLDVFGCRAMDVAIAIQPDGSVSLPCQRLSTKKFKGNLREVYFGEEANKLRKTQGKDPICKGCDLRCMGLASSLLKVKGQFYLAEGHIRNMTGL
jgi:MoaA/NifB/PqqE/SkfB family radical SAM enzyme